MSDNQNSQRKFSFPNLKAGKGKGIWRLLLKAAWITALAFFLSLTLTSPFSATISALFSSSEKSDFAMPDLYFQVADNRPVRKFEDRILLLDIANSNRAEISDILSIVSLCDPKAVVLDINFEMPGDNDEALLENLQSVPNLILPLGVEKKDGKFEISDKPFFYDSINSFRYGVINMPTSTRGGTIREFATLFPMSNGDTLRSLPLETAALTYPETVRGKYLTSEPGIIVYYSKEIPKIHHSELIDRAEELNDKIVIVGSGSEVADVYPTPLRSGMSGMEIHSYALSTILNDEHLRRIPTGISTGAALLLCYLIVLGAIGLKNGFKGIIIRIGQVAALYFLVRIGYSLLVDHQTIADFSQAILMVTFGLFSIDVWSGITALWDWLMKMIRKASPGV